MKRILYVILISVFLCSQGFALTWNNGGGGGGSAGDTTVDAAAFTGNLGVGDTDVQTALATLDAIALGGDTTESNQDDAWATVAGGTETGIDVTYQDATNDVDFVVDVTPSANFATLEISEDAVQVKYDSTDFQEEANGLYLGTDPTISGSLIVDNLTINGNDISSTAGTDLTITPLAGQQIVLDGTIVIDAGEITDATSITSTAFVGDLTGDVTGNTSGTAATVTGAAQAAITSLGTLTTVTIDDITINGNTISSAGASTLAITPTAGQSITFDGAVTVDAGVVAGITTMTLTGANASPTANGMLVYDNVTAGVDDGQFAYYGGSDTVYYFPSYVTLPTDSEDDYHLAYDMDTDRLYWKEDADTGGTPIVITVADSTDTTSSVAFFESATGDLGPKTDSQLTYNATTGALTAVSLVGTTDIETALGAAYDTSGELDTLFNAKAPLASPTFTGTLTVPVGLTGVLRADTGVMSVDGDVTDLVTDGDDDGSTKGIVSFDNDDFNATSGNVTLATTSTAAELNYLDITTLGTGVASKAVVLDGSGNYTAPAGTWDLSGVTAITLRAGEVVLADLDAGVYAKDIVTTAPVTGAADNVLVGADSDVTLALDFTATWNFGSATALEIPNGEVSPASTTGSIALDTNGDGAEFDGPMLVVSTSGATMGYVVTTAGLPGTTEDNYVIKYDADTDLVSWEVDDTGSALGGNLASTTNDITTDNTIIQLEGNSENLTITFGTNTVAITSDTAVASVNYGTIDLGTDALYAAGAALAIGDGADDVVAVDSTVWDITGVGAASFVDLTIAKAEPIIQLDGTDNWEIRSDDTGNSIEISSAIGGGVGDNVELEIDTSGNVTATATFFATVGFDVVGAADIDYGSADVTDHTFITDSTGTAEIVLPAGSIDGTEILDDTIDSADYAADSIDNEHINWSDIDNLDDEGMPIDFALTADATVADAVAIIFGTSSDWNIEYDETTDDRLEFINIVGTAGDSDVYWDLNDTGASTFTIDNSVGTANLVVDGDVTVATLTQSATDNPKWHFDPATVGESDWWLGVYHDTVGDNNDPFEIRQSATENASVMVSVAAVTGDTTITGDLIITGGDINAADETAGKIFVADGTDYTPMAVGGDATMDGTGAVSVVDLTITGEGRGEILTFNPGGAGGWESLNVGAAGQVLTHDGTDVSWENVSATAADAAGVDGVQYEVGGTFTAEAAFYYTQSDNILTVQEIGVGTEEVVIFADVASAVNEITITNAATGVSPSIIPSGETNVGLIIDSKGTGSIVVGSADTTTVTITPATTITGATTLTGGITSIGAAADLSGGTVTLGTVSGSITMAGATSFIIPTTGDAAGEIGMDDSTDILGLGIQDGAGAFISYDFTGVDGNDNYVMAWDEASNKFTAQAQVGSDAFTVKVDAAATAGYLGVAVGDGVFRTDTTDFTVTDGGSFITLGLADSLTMVSPNIGAATGTSLGLSTAGFVGIASNEIITFNAAGTIVASGAVFSSTGGIAAQTPEIAATASLTMSGAGMYGGIYISTSAGTAALPAAAAGMRFTMVVEGSGVAVIDPAASETIYLDGAAESLNENITSSGTAGDYVMCFYRSAAAWACVSDGWDGATD